MSLHPRLFALLAVAALPAYAAPETYVLDPDHTYPSFEMPHMGLSVWRGKFNRARGEVVLDREARRGRVTVEVDADSIDFGHDAMNEHAVTADWLDAARHPKLIYTGALQFSTTSEADLHGRIAVQWRHADVGEGRTDPARRHAAADARHPAIRVHGPSLIQEARLRCGCRSAPGPR